jgi:mannose-6-phosphate isomerase-like protein (cupin superfamily)
MAPNLDPLNQLYSAIRGYLAGKDDPLVQRMARDLPTSPEPRILPPRTYPVADHLAKITRASDPDATGLRADLALNRAAFQWGQSYGEDDFGPDFINNYAYLEILGTRGHFRSDTVACGLLMIGPNTAYPAHRHTAEEIYVIVSGTAAWMKAGSDYEKLSPGTVVHHPSQIVHAMRTDTEPLVVIYIWRGGDLAQKSEVSGLPQAPSISATQSSSL